MATATTTSTSTAALPAWHSGAWEALYNRADTLSQVPYQLYGDPRIAGFSADQLQAMQLGRDRIGAAQPIMDQAVGAAQGALQTPNQAGIAQYMNPYDNLVTQQILTELTRQNDLAGQADAAAAVKVGAFGGDRYGLVQAERDRNLMRTQADVLSQRGAASYMAALDQYNKQQALGLQGAGIMSNLAGNTQQLNNVDMSTLLGIGTLQQGQQQQQLDVDYNDFQRQAQYPYTQVNFLRDVLSGTPTQQTTNTTQTQPAPSSAAQWLGLGLGAVGIGASAAKAFGWF